MIEFASPQEFMNFFVNRTNLSFDAGTILVIRNTGFLRVKEIWDKAIPNVLSVDPALYFLNRIMLPLGKSLVHMGDQTPFELTFEDGNVIISRDVQTSLKLIKGCIVSSISDIFFRMVQSSKLLFSLEKEYQMLMVFPKDVPFNKNKSIAELVSSLMRYYLPSGFEFSHNIIGQGVPPLELVLEGKYRLFEISNPTQIEISLNHNYKYDSPVSLGRIIAFQGGFSLAARQPITVSNVLDVHSIRLIESNDPREKGKGLRLFFNQCLNHYGLAVKSLTTKGHLKCRITTMNEFELSFTDAFRLEVGEAEEFIFDLSSFSTNMLMMPPFQRVLHFQTDRPATFLMSQKEEQEVNLIIEKRKSDQITYDQSLGGIMELIFPYLGTTIGLQWEQFIHVNKCVKIISPKYNVPALLINARGYAVIRPEFAVDLIVKIIENAPKVTQEAFLKHDIAANRYVLYRTFMEILNGMLDSYNENLQALGLKVSVREKIEVLKADWDFFQVREKTRGAGAQEVKKIFELNHEEISKISMDSYSRPVQSLLQTVIGLTNMEYSNSVFLSRYCEEAKEVLKEVKSII